MPKPVKWNPSQVAAPLGKYSHLTSVPEGSQLVFIAGQVGNDSQGDVDGSGSHAQTVLALQNIEALLNSLGAGPEHLVRLLTFVSGKENLPGFFIGRDEVFSRWFPEGDYPGHSLAVVEALVNPNLLVEVEGWAAIPAREVEARKPRT